ncbi:MAG: RusA family crossover junction endodeoxyribonuclease [Thalassolituus sp.]|uniref:RusA family crossover junction endodeoxyribonuclease n=1 Tax=Thalassolituus sp. TaxID=2030822 RepID=UPI0039826E3A
MNDHLGKEPPEYGEIVFEVNRSPVSLQSKSEKKKEFKDFVSSIVKEAGFLLSGDVKLFIEWRITEQHRYEHASAYDVDNIIKPLLDVLSGPNGVLVDDNQVQSVECYWTDIFHDPDEKLIITIKYVHDEWLPKDGLEFLSFEGSLCLPIWGNIKPEHQKMIIERYESGINFKNKALESGIGYYQAKLAMPIQRVFHKGRLTGFKITSATDRIAQINKS